MPFPLLTVHQAVLATGQHTAPHSQRKPGPMQGPLWFLGFPLKTKNSGFVALLSFLGRMRTEVKWAGDKSGRATNYLWRASTSTCPFPGTAGGVGSRLSCLAERSWRPRLPMWLRLPCSQRGGLRSSGPSGPSNWRLQVQAQQGLLSGVLYTL